MVMKNVGSEQYDPETKCWRLQLESLVLKKVNLKLTGQNHTDLLFYTKRINHSKPVPPEQSNKHSIFKFWNVYSGALIKKTKSFARQADFVTSYNNFGKVIFGQRTHTCWTIHHTCMIWPVNHVPHFEITWRLWSNVMAILKGHSQNDFQWNLLAWHTL